VGPRPVWTDTESLTPPGILLPDRVSSKSHIYRKMSKKIRVDILYRKTNKCTYYCLLTIFRSQKATEICRCGQ
jgi:hypothetical protein